MGVIVGVVVIFVVLAILASLIERGAASRILHHRQAMAVAEIASTR